MSAEKKSIEQAAEDFVSYHKAGVLDLDHIDSGYGSVSGFLSAEGQPSGDLGGWSIEIKAHEHKDGWVDTVEWFEDTYQIAHYRLPFADRISPEDHTPVLDFCPDFNWCIEHIEDLIEQGYCDISLDEVVEGVVADSVAFEDYLEQTDYQSACTISCCINHRKQDGSDLTEEDVILEMTYAIQNLFRTLGGDAHEMLQLTQTHKVSN